MATYNPSHTSILDTPHGHVGPVIFYTWKGIDCVRSMPQHYHDARTPEQLQNRSKLSILMAFLSPLKNAIRNGYRHTVHQTSELNEATRVNYRTALTIQGITAHIDYPNTYLSWGDLPRLANLQYLVLNNELLIHWDQQDSFNPNDQICITLYNAKRHTAQFHPHCATRHEQATTIPIPQSWQHDQLHIWIWLNGSTQNSTSQYLGTLNPQPHHQSHHQPQHQTHHQSQPQSHHQTHHQPHTQDPIQPPAQTQTPTPPEAQKPTPTLTPTPKNNPPIALDSKGPKCYQTPLSLGSESGPKGLNQSLPTPPKIPDATSRGLI